MLIKELNLEHFGKFQHKKIAFQDGINLVYGDNEDGKSTVHSFIKGMLFGIEKPRGRETKEDLYSRYQPWDTKSLYTGSLDLSLEDKNYRIYRNFYKETRELKVHDLGTGRELLTEIGQPLELLGGLNKSNYSNTISIPQLKVGIDKTLAMEVQNYIANLSATKSNEVDVSNAYLSLMNTKKEILSNKTEQKMKDLFELIQIEQKEEEHLAKMFEELHILEKQEVQAEQEVQKQQGELQKNKQIEKEIEKEIEIKAIEEYIRNYPVVVEKYRNYLAVLEEMKQQDKTQSKLEQKERAIKKENLPNETVKSAVTMSLSVMLLLGGIFWSNIWMTMGGFTIFMFAIFLLLASKASRNRRDNLQWLKDKASKLRSEILTYGSKVCEMDGINEEAMQRLGEGIEYLKNEVNRNKRFMQQEKQGRLLKIERLKWEMNQIEERINKVQENQSVYNQLKRLQLEENDKIAAIELAIRTIDKISLEIHEGFGKSLNDEISKIVLQVTNGSYSKVYVDEQFNICLERGHQFVSLERLSVGTIHQVYLALRLAVTQLLFPESELPVILDEPFAFYDENRLIATLNMLQQRKKQIIIFTCHAREKEIIENMGINYNFITL